MNRHQSIYKASHSIGANRTNRTVNLPDLADEILTSCRPRGVSISVHLREMWARGLESYNARIGQNFRSAINQVRSYLSGSFKTRAQVLEESLNELRAEKPDTQMSNYIDRMMAEECAELGVK